MSDNKELERELSEMLTEQEIGSEEERKREERRRLSPRYEIRIQTNLDPIVEETRKYRSMAKEVDGRYDDYMKRAAQTGKEQTEK
ncbi:hypothetical protein J25TS5_44190 [Paenibacillus faecis]|uniref:Uncharacterized protein n=1 Tax=Paenibacillus faecis TaxID=862114 RepID=A0A5D0CPJ4_9BACL|nr:MULTISPECIES: hypothetical protein [Paenibacillus]MCA1296490.1 hypothetical protein [Paenibacillus sp. alder61]TYA11702.1 hypothetical protein FRY98_21550 [Paenibacillus faecis]GIO87487.1 hypothetical protein J25TS5_44190 [Paenibacillus faecis]